MSLEISRILHAGYIFKCENTQIALDPIFENPFSHNCYAYPNVQFDREAIRGLKLDAVFISHFHDDHCSFESLDLLNRDTPIYMFCVFEEMFILLRDLGFKNVFSLQLNKPIQIGSIEVIPRKALDEDVDSLFQIKAGGVNVLNVVDSWIDDETLKLLVNEAPWDLVLWPFQTMRELEVIAPTRTTAIEPELPAEWKQQIKALDPRFIVPSSCQLILENGSWYNQAFFPISYKKFQEEMNALVPNMLVVRMNPGVTFKLNLQVIESATPLAWIKPVGEQQVDYVYHNTLTVPLTSEIAKKFSALTSEELTEVKNYCEHELIEKYNSLEASELDKLDWQLSLFDHEGGETKYFYRIAGGKIAKLTAMNKPNWKTEIASAKLYAALTKGETLTSLYLRIENDDHAVDLVEDPLIKSLYTNNFGAYQKAQLKRLCEATLN